MKLKLGNEFDKDYMMITDMKQLENIEQHSCEEVYIGGALDSVDFPARFQILDVMINKMLKGGVIKLAGVDLQSIILDYTNGLIKEEQLIHTLYIDRRSCDSLNNLVAFLQNRGIQITHRVFNNSVYSIEGVRA